MRTWTTRFETLLFVRSRTMAPPWGPILRALRYPVALLRDWLAGELNVRAMGLAYTTLLSIAPIVVFCFLILKFIGARTNLDVILYAFFRPAGAAATELTTTIMQSVRAMRGDVLGSLGVVFLAYTVLTTIQKVEASFHFVWRVENPRSLVRRWAGYLTVMILGPVLMAAALGVLASAKNGPVAHWLGTVVPLGWTLSLLGTLTPYVIVTACFTGMYALIPHTGVEFRAALIGGSAAGLAWALVGKVFTSVLFYTSQMLFIYSGFAVVLTTLIWLYLSWLILLLGAQLSFYLQMPEYLPIGQRAVSLTGSARETAAVEVMLLVSQEPQPGGQRWTAALIAAQLQIPGTALSPLLASLEAAGLLRTRKGVLVATDTPDRITLAAIIAAARAPTDPHVVALRSHAAADAVAAQIEGALRTSLGTHTLAELGTAAR